MTDFGATPLSDTTIGANQIPMGCVFVPNTAGGVPTAAEGIAINTDSNGFKSTAVRLGLQDGDDVTQGLKGDVAVTGDTGGTISSKLRGLNKMFSSVWDSVNNLLHFNLKMVGGTAVDTNSGNKSAGTQRVVIATDQPVFTNAQPVSLTPIAGVGYIFKEVKNISVTAGTGLSIWTPNSGKKFLLLGIMLAVTSATVAAISLQDTVTYNANNEFARLPRVQTNNFTPVPVPLGTDGYLSTTANNQLWIDVTATTTVEGFVWGKEV